MNTGTKQGGVLKADGEIVVINQHLVGRVDTKSKPISDMLASVWVKWVI